MNGSTRNGFLVFFYVGLGICLLVFCADLFRVVHYGLLNVFGLSLIVSIGGFFTALQGLKLLQK